MKVKYSDLNLLNICLANILATSNSLSGKVIHTFSKNTRLIKPFLEEADNSRKKIVDQYVDKDKDGKQKYKKLTDEEQEVIAHMREEIKKGDFIPFQEVFPE